MRARATEHFVTAERFAAMQQLYVTSGMALAMLMALGHNAVAQIDCNLPNDVEMESLINATYISEVTVTLLRNHRVCLVSGMYRDQWSSASFLVGYTCTPVASCNKGPEVEKELLDLRCEDGAWSVHAVNATPAATSFETPLFTSCSSCVSPTEIKESDEEHHCVGKYLACEVIRPHFFENAYCIGTANQLCNRGCIEPVPVVRKVLKFKKNNSL